MKHLYQKIYLTIIGCLALLVILTGFLMKMIAPDDRFGEVLKVAGDIAVALLPSPDTSREETKRQVLALSGKLNMDIALYSPEKKLITATTSDLPAPEREDDEYDHDDDEDRFDWRSDSWIFMLPDNRWLVVRLQSPKWHKHGPWGGIMFVGVIALLIALAVYPAARGLTRRLERLQRGVITLGAGDLSARVAVEGKDEIGRLAKSFNTSAERIEELVNAHKDLLANASHELRTPLSRLRVTVELLQDKAGEKHKADLETDIAELNGLIDEILVASRLNSLHEMDRTEEVDLLALIAEETSRFPDYTLSGEPVMFTGDPRLLRRMVRNLLVNADRYGKLPVFVNLKQSEDLIELSVLDSGEGIHEDDMEKIFEPFYRPAGSGSAVGSGLGLSLVQQIARRHGGNAVVSPSNGETSGFVVTLPRVSV